jgi:predicted enzyme related to lactoylglutathione lyase
MNITEIAFAGYPVTDLKRACAFYAETLGLKETARFGDDQAAWIEFDIGACTLAITNFVPGWRPASAGAALGLEVDDFDAAVARLRERGVSFLKPPFETPVCHMATVSDPDGNLVILHQRKRQAP